MDNETVQAEVTETVEEAVEAAPAVETEAAPEAVQEDTTAPATQEEAPSQERKPYRQNNGRGRRRKVCLFCTEKTAVIDYKDPIRLRKFVSERGKILPRRVSGTCAKHQRELTTAIKRARVIALLPYVAD